MIFLISDGLDMVLEFYIRHNVFTINATLVVKCEMKFNINMMY